MPNWRRHTTYITINDEFPIMELLPGTPLVFKWLIMAAHHPRTEHSGGYWIGQSLELAEIRELAKLSYQHNALHLIATSARQWIEALYPPGWKLQNPEEYSDQLDYLWLSYELGVEKLFHDIWYGVSTPCVSANQKPKSSANGSIVNSFNLAYVCKVEFWNPASMPPGIFGKFLTSNPRRLPISILTTEPRHVVCEQTKSIAAGETSSLHFSLKSMNTRLSSFMRSNAAPTWTALSVPTLPGRKSPKTVPNLSSNSSRIG